MIWLILPFKGSYLQGLPSQKKCASSEFSGESALTFEPQHEISNNVVCATSKGSDQSAHTRSLIRAFAFRLNNLRLLAEQHLEF